MNRGLDPQSGAAVAQPPADECQHESIERDVDIFDKPRWRCANTTCRRTFHPEDAHMWINAFSLIRPKDEFLMEIGRDVVGQLQVPGHTAIHISAT